MTFKTRIQRAALLSLLLPSVADLLNGDPPQPQKPDVPSFSLTPEQIKAQTKRARKAARRSKERT